MEFIKTKLFGGEVNVLFTGPNYFFFHGFYGIICIAERDEEVELSNNEGEWKSKFVLYAGHAYGDIEKECFALAKKIIRKHDQKHVKKTFEFEERVVDLHKAFVQVSYDLNRFGK